MKQSKMLYSISGYDRPTNQAGALIEHFTATPSDTSVYASDVQLDTEQVIINQVEDVPTIIPETKVLNGIDIPGFDLPRMPIKNIANHQACYQICQKDPQCQFMTYNQNNKDCWLKIGNKVKQVTTQGDGFYYDQTDIPRFDMPQMPIKNISSSEQCHNLCRAKPNCHWINYNQDNHDCWLKQGGNFSHLSTQFKPRNYVPEPAPVPPPPPVPAPSQASIWGVNAQNNIWYREGITPASPTGTSWKQVDGALISLSIGPKGQVWGCNSKDNIFFRHGPSGTWKQIEGGLIDISVGSNNEVWGVARNGTIWFRSGITPNNLMGTHWIGVDGQLTRISSK